MSRRRVAVLVVGLMGSGLGPGAASAVVLGGGDAGKDCRVAFAGTQATHEASQVVCPDGGACDLDGTADGTCRFEIALCVGVSQRGCAPTRLDAIAVAGLPLDPPLLPAPAETCGAPTAVAVAVGTVAAATVLAHDGRALRDVDYLNLCCVPDEAVTPSGDGRLAAAACAVQVDVSASGCPDVPVRAVERLRRAADLVVQAAAEPARARRHLRRARRLAGKVRRMGRRLARRRDCGHALALMATHARALLRAAAR